MYNTDVLSHHGIDNQKWGVRNGPPYPLKRDSIGRVIKSKAENAGEKIKKRLNKPAVAIQKKQSSDNRSQNNENNTFKSKSAREILFNQGSMNNKELSDAINRYRLEATLNSLAAQEEYAERQKKIAPVVSVIKAGGWYFKTVWKAYKNIKEFYNTPLGGALTKELHLQNTLDDFFYTGNPRNGVKGNNSFNNKNKKKSNFQTNNNKTSSSGNANFEYDFDYDIFGQGTSSYQYPSTSVISHALSTPYIYVESNRIK